MRVTGERIVTPQGGFNASWQRHAACYVLSEQFLGRDAVVDLGCGTGHASETLAPRRTLGVDIHHDSLVSQPRETVAADIRQLPFATDLFGSVLCIHAIEHLPEPEPLLKEAFRVLKPDGVAIFITPNRLTFGRPDEIIDPYHYVEYDPAQLEALCRSTFGSVEMFGIFGSDRYMEFFSAERAQLDSLLKKDPLKLRRMVPRRVRQVLYDWGLTVARRRGPAAVSDFSVDDFRLESTDLQDSLDLLAVCKKSPSGGS